MPRSAPDLLAELRELVAAHADAGVATPVDGVLLGKVERSMTPEYSLADPVLVVMAQGGKRLMLGDRVHEYRAGDFLIVTASVPVTGHFFDATPEAPALAMGLVLRPSVIASLLLEAPARSSARRDAPLPAIAVGEATDELLDAAVRMVRLLDHPADAAVLAPLVEREHEPLHLPSPFPRGGRDESPPVPEADPAAGGPVAAAGETRRHRRRRTSRRIRQPVAVQPRVPAALRSTAGTGRRAAPRDDGAGHRRTAAVTGATRRPPAR
jgi:hypothetical protein